MNVLITLAAALACAAATYIDPTKPERRPGDPIGCFEKGQGDFALPENNGCNQEFVACKDYGYFEILPCPHGGYYFDEYSGRCLIKEYVYACGGTHTEAQPEPEPIPHDDTVDCYGKDDGIKLLPEALRGTCQNFYYECISGRQYGVRRDCGAETYFDEKYMDCIDHYEHEVCSGGTRKPYEPTPEPDEVERVYIEFECKWGAGNYKHPDYDCSPYHIQCDPYGVAELVPCPGYPYTFYDYEIDACGNFYDVPACSGKERPVPEATTRYPKVEADYDCSVVPDGNYAYYYNSPTCTDSYVACVRHDVRGLFECPYGTIFVNDDMNKGHCEVGHCPSYAEPEPPVYPAPEPYYPVPEPIYPQPEPAYPQPEPQPQIYGGSDSVEAAGFVANGRVIDGVGGPNNF